MTINDLIVGCASAFKLVRESPSSGRENAITAAVTLSAAITSICLQQHPELKVKTGLGVGSFPEVPWVGILHSGMGHNATAGYYLVLLFSRDSKRVYLTYGVGAGAGATASLSNKDFKDAELRAIQLRSHCNELTKFGFLLSNDIDLASNKPRPRAYKSATAAYVEYDIHELAQGANVTAALSGAINIYLKHVKSGLILGNRTPLNSTDEGQESMTYIISFISSLESPNLAVSLLAKPFAIVTGNSGTGKTRAAEKLAMSLSCGNVTNFSLVSVGSDWTDNRSILGYINHLKEIPHEGQRKPMYQSTAVLDLLLNASQTRNQNLPFFLILDEMNLSHVERYFSDFLSAMETSNGEIRLHCEGASEDFDFRLPRNENDNIGVPRTLKYPANFFVIGTVNVDETTYMFSPKVLDRANVIEFRVTQEDAAAFLAAGAGGVGDIATAPAGAAQAFLALSRKARQKPVPDLVLHTDAALADKRKALSESLVELFGIMHKHRMEFGYRTMHEVLRYAGVDCELAADRATWSWAACLDVQILQKILPKLHGSKKRIEQLLVDLAVFCETGAAPAGDGVFKASSTAKIVYRESYAKLADMIEIVRRDQFVSFI